MAGSSQDRSIYMDAGMDDASIVNPEQTMKFYEEEGYIPDEATIRPGEAVTRRVKPVGEGGHSDAGGGGHSEAGTDPDLPDQIDIMWTLNIPWHQQEMKVRWGKEGYGVYRKVPKKL